MNSYLFNAYNDLATAIKNNCEFKDTRMYDSPNCGFSFENYFHLSERDKKIFINKLEELLHSDEVNEFNKALHEFKRFGGTLNSAEDFIKIGDSFCPDLYASTIDDVKEFYKFLYERFVLYYKDGTKNTDEEVIKKLFNNDYDSDFIYIIEEIFNKKFVKQGYVIYSSKDFINIGKKLFPSKKESVEKTEIKEKEEEKSMNSKTKKKNKKHISIFKRIINRLKNNSSEFENSEENENLDIIYPDIFNIKEEDEESIDVIYPEIFDINEAEEHKEVPTNFVPEVPVFRDPKQRENIDNTMLSKQLEDSKDNLQQIKNNIGELHQKTNTIIEEMNLLNQDIIEQEETINQELNDKDNEFDNIISDEETVDLIKDNEEKLPTGSFNDNDIVETEFIDNNPKDDLENQINKDYKPKHLKREDKPSKDETKQKIEEDIKSCERMIEILSYKTILNESDEQKEYVKDKIKLYKNKLRNLRRQHKKYEIQSYDIQFIERRKKLESKLDKIEKNDANKQIISDIEIAISQIDSYMKYSDAYKNGFISEDELNNKGNNTYMIVDYVMNERQKRTRK